MIKLWSFDDPVSKADPAKVFLHILVVGLKKSSHKLLNNAYNNVSVNCYHLGIYALFFFFPTYYSCLSSYGMTKNPLSKVIPSHCP